MNEDLQRILTKLEQIDSKLAEVDGKVDIVHSEMARHEDLLAVTVTLEQITLDEVAVAKELAEDKAEAAYILNKSITYGTEKRLTEKIDKLEQKMDERFEQVDQRFEQVDQRFEQVDQRFEQIDQNFEKVIGSLNNISDIMRAWVYKQSEVDRDLQEIKRKLNGE
ncbi:hypothetical protein [Hazenella coriacea]|uniref:Uncharacterized protein n=1 Tax=Hazenella coriacea TaxID=1179467 RepID=A0A4R3L7P8_9BACL|nr:hypothetical protein [Hazenella coriacea]TCS95000.1 hypothetical protein EDD58_103425 [Hazenella coriacea]